MVYQKNASHTCSTKPSSPGQSESGFMDPGKHGCWCRKHGADTFAAAPNNTKNIKKGCAASHYHQTP